MIRRGTRAGHPHIASGTRAHRIFGPVRAEPRFAGAIATLGLDPARFRTAALGGSLTAVERRAMCGTP